MDGLAGNDISPALAARNTDWRAGHRHGNLYCFCRRRECQPDDGCGLGGDAEGDTLATIENLTGSNLDDTLEGNGGSNILAGGLGIDTVSYEHALAGVTVSLASTKAQNTLVREPTH